MTQDVTIPVNLSVCCSRYSSLERYGKAYIIELNGYQIIDMLTEKIISELVDIYYMLYYPNEPHPRFIEYFLKFEVGFDDEGEIDAVDLFGEGVSDILSDGILKELKEKARENYISDCRDVGKNVKEGM